MLRCDDLMWQMEAKIWILAVCYPSGVHAKCGGGFANLDMCVPQTTLPFRHRVFSDRLVDTYSPAGSGGLLWQPVRQSWFVKTLCLKANFKNLTFSKF